MINAMFIKPYITMNYFSVSLKLVTCPNGGF